jgi:hypothetical protein
MRDPKESSDFEEKLLEAGRELFNYVIKSVHGDAWSKAVAIVILICVFLVIGAVFFKALTKAFEESIKFFEFYKNSSLNLVFSAQKKKIIRKRKQFCSVLDADLAYIAKAESWNDQYFTDLEAEVETEGGYYASSFDRVRKRRSFGLRRVTSLMRAIETSTERAVLLVGDPGSGKSVALRHFAKQLAEKGKTSNNSKALIPLYLNLRELEVPPNTTINADLIQQFVIENIRRGDADTSAFVQDNWSRNKEEGIWIFLFDSFDEIPDVLHAASGSVAVKEYSKAIRQFLDGMGECRSILASREYKGPEALPWRKFRILPLNKDRQRMLVENSFLEDRKKNLVNQHLATERSTLGNNPLFLTLLCRFVKDLSVQPANDHQLLTSHLERLSAREPDYILKKYGLTSDQLMTGAQRLAVLFASNPSLSLAPRVDEIFLALPENEFLIEDLQNLISALVDVKIGRNDVATARQGDRRFAFSHRRYQETLFANFLAENPGYISSLDLLSKPEWRDYAVTLLQSQSIDGIREMLEVATEILISKANLQIKTASKYMPEKDIGFFEWHNEDFVAVLLILQEGLARRLQDVPERLSVAIFSLLGPRWASGDYLDRYMVVKLGGLLPQSVLIEYLKFSLSNERPEISALAFKQCVFLRESSGVVNKLICRKLARETLSADKTITKLRLEALAGRLPTSVGARFVFRRCVKLRAILAKLSVISWIMLLPNYIFAQLLKVLPLRGMFQQHFSRIHPKFVYRGGNDWVIAMILPLIFLATHAVAANTRAKKPEDNLYKLTEEFIHSNYFVPVLGIYIFVMMILIGLYRLRDEGQAIKISSIFSLRRLKSLIVDMKPLVFSLCIFAVLALIPLLIGNLVKLAANFLKYNLSVDSLYGDIGLPISFGIAMLIVGIGVWQESRENTKRVRHFEYLKTQNHHHNDDGYLLLQAPKFQDAEAWLTVDPSFLTAPAEQVRSVSALIREIPNLREQSAGESYPLISSDFDQAQYAKLNDKVALRVLSLGQIT